MHELAVGVGSDKDNRNTIKNIEIPTHQIHPGLPTPEFKVQQYAGRQRLINVHLSFIYRKRYHNLIGRIRENQVIHAQDQWIIVHA